METTSTRSATVVGVFTNRAQANRAIKALRSAGFRNSQIGVLARDETTNADQPGTEEKTATSASGPIGLGLISGMIPVTGPAFAAGTLGLALSGQAGIAGLSGALVGWGLPEGEVTHYQGEFKSGKIIVTVLAEGRDAKAVQYCTTRPELSGPGCYTSLRW